MKNILLIGSHGNLGTEIKSCFDRKDYTIFVTSKNHNSKEEIYFDGTKPLILPKNLKIDLIINAANDYYVTPNHEEMISMRNATIGIAENILLSNLSCPILFFSSYLQYLPNNLQPWSTYTIMKSEAVEIFRQYGRNRKVATIEIALYDNYGGKRRNKFFDLALDSIVHNKVLKATSGDTVLNLTHIQDIVRNLWSLVDQDISQFKELNDFSFSIQTSDTFTLKNLVEYIEKISGISVPIEWGANPYRAKEVFQYYYSKPILPSFYQGQTLDSYILDYLKLT
jgi:nucleoside-diphosphate-sugar epimerase